MRASISRRNRILLSITACALMISASLFGASPAHAVRNQAEIREFFMILSDGNVSHTITVIDYSKTLTQDACDASPMVQQWSQTRFTDDSYLKQCEITTDFKRATNPYVGVDQDGKVTFAAAPLELKDLSLGLPEDISVIERRVDFTGGYLAITKGTKGAELVESDPTSDSVRWINDLGSVVGAEGYIQGSSSYSHPIERKDFNELTAVPLPTEMTDFPHSRTIAAPTSYTPSPSASSYTPSPSASSYTPSSTASSPSPFSLGWLINRVINPVIGVGLGGFFVWCMWWILKKGLERNKTQARILVPSDYQAQSSAPPTPTPTVQEPHNPFDSEWRNPSA